MAPDSPETPEVAAPDWFESWPDVGAESEPSGWTSHIHRALGQGDSPVFTEDTTKAVKAIQLRAGLEPTGVVSGKAWALFMPEYKLGNVGREIGFVRQSLGLKPTHWFTQDLADALETDTLDRAKWAELVGLTLEDEPDDLGAALPDDGGAAVVESVVVVTPEGDLPAVESVEDIRAAAAAVGEEQPA